MSSAIRRVAYIVATSLCIGVLGALVQPVSAQSSPQTGIVNESDGSVLTDPENKSTKCAGGAGQAFLTFPAWYKGLVDDSCQVLSPTDEGVGGISGFIWKIVLNGVEIILNLVGYAAAGYILFGGFKYITSTGSPDGMVAARKTIMNAVIGLVISIAAVAIVRSISSDLGVG